MNRSMPGLPVHHQLPEFTQTHVHRVGDAIQPSHPLSFPSPPAPNPSQHQSFPMSQLFTWYSQSSGVSALALFFSKKPQGWSPSEWTGWISLQSKGLSWVFYNTLFKKPKPIIFFNLKIFSLICIFLFFWYKKETTILGKDSSESTALVTIVLFLSHFINSLLIFLCWSSQVSSYFFVSCFFHCLNIGI